MIANFKTSSAIPPQLVGGIGQGGRMDDFNKKWKMQKCLQDVFVVGRRDGRSGCFSLTPYGEGWDIGYYLETPKDIFKVLRDGGAVDASYHTSDPHNKYLALDLIDILKKRNLT